MSNSPYYPLAVSTRQLIRYKFTPEDVGKSKHRSALFLYAPKLMQRPSKTANNPAFKAGKKKKHLKLKAPCPSVKDLVQELLKRHIAVKIYSIAYAISFK